MKENTLEITELEIVKPIRLFGLLPRKVVLRRRIGYELKDKRYFKVLTIGYLDDKLKDRATPFYFRDVETPYKLAITSEDERVMPSAKILPGGVDGRYNVVSEFGVLNNRGDSWRNPDRNSDRWDADGVALGLGYDYMLGCFDSIDAARKALIRWYRKWKNRPKLEIKIG